MKKLLKKIYIKGKSTAVSSLIVSSLFFRWPEMTAFVIALSANKVNKNGEYKILCMRRSIFMDDVRAMAEYSGRLQYIVVGRDSFQKILNFFFGGPKKRSITELNYHAEDFQEEAKKKYRGYLERMLPVLKQKLQFDAVLSANFVYLEQQEWARVCENAHIPFIVLFKEGFVTPGYHQEWSNKVHKTCVFTGAKMMIYNEDIRDALIGSNIKNLSEKNTVVVGVPRMDIYIRERQNKEKKAVTLFSAYFHDKLSFLLGAGADLELVAKKVDDFHAMVMRYAKNHPDTRVVIKTKLASHFLQYVEDIFNKHFKNPIPNLMITNTENPTKLIQESFAIIGFGSTTLVEALAAHKKILCFDFGEAIPSKSFDYFHENPEFVEYISSDDELENALENKKENKDPKKMNELLKKFIYIPDGDASKRTEEEIIQTILSYERQ